jgi:hypothetical protein
MLRSRMGLIHCSEFFGRIFSGGLKNGSGGAG